MLSADDFERLNPRQQMFVQVHMMEREGVLAVFMNRHHPFKLEYLTPFEAESLRGGNFRAFELVAHANTKERARVLQLQAQVEPRFRRALAVRRYQRKGQWR